MLDPVFEHNICTALSMFMHWSRSEGMPSVNEPTVLQGEGFEVDLCFCTLDGSGVLACLRGEYGLDAV